MVSDALGTRQRIKEANRYRPSNPTKAARKTRKHESGAVDTYKKRGDVIIDAFGRKYEVTRNGF